MKDENGIEVTEEGKIMEVWKRNYQTFFKDEEAEKEENTTRRRVNTRNKSYLRTSAK